MQQTDLTLVANYRPETLERILRVVRHRGFSLTNVQMKLENDKIWLDLRVHSGRDKHLLINQLIKLYDVIDVNAD